MTTNSWTVKEVGGMIIKECSIDLPYNALVFDEPAKIYDFYKNVIINSPRFTDSVENGIVLLFNVRRKLINYQIISTGTVDSAFVHPREVFRLAILNNAHSVVFCHNHPSGDTSPSEADIKVSRDLIRAGQILKIEVADSIIFGRESATEKGFSSLRELGYFYV